MKLSDNIHLLDFDFTDQIRNHLYLIEDSGEALLIDAHIGTAAEKVLEAIQEIIGLDKLGTVLLTHGHMDHTGACPLIEERTNAEIAVHIADAQYVEDPWIQFLTLYQNLNISANAYEDFLKLAGGRGVTVTRPLHDGDTLKVGTVKLHIIHTPGHSPGSVCIYEQDTKTLFSGDVLIPSDWFPRRLGVIQDAHTHLRSLERLSNMDIKVLCPGHEPIHRDSEVEREFTLHFKRFDEIESSVLNVMTESDALSLSEITERVAEQVLSAEKFEESLSDLVTIRGFLYKLCYEGKLIQERGPLWKLAR